MAETKYLHPVADAQITRETPNDNYGSHYGFTVGLALIFGNYYLHRSLIRFPILDNIPEKATIVSAKLKLKPLAFPYETRVTVKIHLVSVDWREDTVTWASHNDKYTYYYVTGSSVGEDWTDYEVKDLVQKIVNKEFPEYGFMLINANEDDSNFVISFHSKESAATQYRPYLVVTYETPTPPTTPPTPTEETYKGIMKVFQSLMSLMFTLVFLMMLMSMMTRVFTV
jgi:hypothetical protein